MAKHTCSVDHCEHPAKALGYCNGHYMRVRNFGSPQIDIPLRTAASSKTSPAERIAAQVTKNANGCHVFTGYIRPSGYGEIRIRGALWLTHRLSWTLANGDIPDGLVINHLCRNGTCQNVDHMELVTQGENALHGGGILACAELKRGAKFCRAGHPRNGWTTKVDTKGRSYCLICKRISGKRSDAKRRKPQTVYGPEVRRDRSSSN